MGSRKGGEEADTDQMIKFRLPNNQLSIKTYPTLTNTDLSEYSFMTKTGSQIEELLPGNSTLKSSVV